MKVYVAGANGAIGRRLVPQLIAAGHDVVGAVRWLPATQEIRRLGAEPVMVDGLDEKAVLDAVSRSEPEVVIHEMTSITKGGDIRHFDRDSRDERAAHARHRLPVRGAQLAARDACRAELHRLAEHPRGRPGQGPSGPTRPETACGAAQTCGIRYLERRSRRARRGHRAALRQPLRPGRLGSWSRPVRARQMPISAPAQASGP